MNHPRNMAAVGLAMLVAMMAIPVADLRSGEQEVAVSGNPAPTAEQIRSVFERLAENQHRNDRIAEEYERVEHVVSRKAGKTSEVLSDKTNRVMPSGTGIMRFEIARNGVSVSPEQHRRDLQFAIRAYELVMNPNEREKQDLAKFERRRREKAELVDGAIKAFHATWEGRETRGSRTLAKFLIEPDPSYKPTSREARLFEHVRATVWVDESEAQMARMEGDITSDVSYGGVLVKLYRGGHFVMEQSEIAPGLWMPTLYTYDVDGREFLFGFGIHETTELTQYRRLGPPAQAIEIVRKELNSLAADPPAR
jgi:hypothetical protein